MTSEGRSPGDPGDAEGRRGGRRGHGGHGGHGGAGRARRILIAVPVVLLIAWLIGGWGTGGDGEEPFDPGPLPTATAT